MRELIISEAPLARIASITKEVVEDVGGVLSSHTHHATRFDHLRITDDAWSRSGYVGTYQEHGSPVVRVRVRVWASSPRRFFLGFLYLGLAEAVVFFLMALLQVPPPANIWILTAILTFLAIGLSLLTYSTSWAASADLEETLVRRIGSEAQSDPEVPGDVYTLGGWQEHRQDVIEEALARVPQDERVSRGPLAGSALLQRVRSGGGGDAEASDEDGGDADRAGQKRRGLRARLGTAGEGADDADEGTDDRGQRPGLLARLPFGGSSDQTAADDPEPDDGDDAAEEEPAQEGGDEDRAVGLMARLRGRAQDDAPADAEQPGPSRGWRSRLPFGGQAEDDADQGSDDDPPTRRAGLMERLPFGRSKGEDEEADADA